MQKKFVVSFASNMITPPYRNTRIAVFGKYSEPDGCLSSFVRVPRVATLFHDCMCVCLLV